MNVNEFIDKFDSLSKEERDAFLAYTFGCLTTSVMKEYEVIQRAFEFVEKTK